jgi:hypothetical protein
VSGGEHPRIINPVGARGWHRGREPTEQGERVEVDGGGAIRERSFDQDATRFATILESARRGIPEGGHEPASEPADSVLGERRAQDVLTQGLASAGVAGGSGGGGDGSSPFGQSPSQGKTDAAKRRRVGAGREAEAEEVTAEQIVKQVLEVVAVP